MEPNQITDWFNNWSLPQKEYTATELYNDYKVSTDHPITIYHFGRLLSNIRKHGYLIYRIKNGKRIYYKFTQPTATV